MFVSVCLSRLSTGGGGGGNCIYAKIVKKRDI
jgi:hypothetical protein